MDQRIAKQQGRKAAPAKAAKPKRRRKGDDPDDGTGGVLARVG
jgi:hypothetical protein